MLSKLLSKQHVNVNLKRNIGEIFWLLISQFSTIAAGFLFLKVVTGLIGSKSYGEVNVYMTISIFANSLIYGPLSNGVQRICSISISNGDFGDFSDAVNALLKRSLFIVLLLQFALSIPLILLGYFQILAVSSLVLLFSICMGTSTVLNSIQNALRRRKNYALQQSITPFLRIASIFSIVYCFEGEVLIKYFVGYLIAEFLMMLYALYNFKKSIVIYGQIETSPTKIKYYRSELKNYIMPFVYWGVFSWIQSSSDRWALSYFTDFKSVGLYSVLYQLGVYPVLIIGSLMNNFATPILFQSASDKTKEAYRATKSKYLLFILGTLILVVILGLGTYFFDEAIFNIAVDSSFQVVSNKLSIIVISSGLIVVAQVVAIIFNITLRTKKLVPIQVLLPLFCIIILFLGAKNYGLDGVVYGSLIYGILYLSGISIFAFKELFFFKTKLLSN